MFVSIKPFNYDHSRAPNFQFAPSGRIVEHTNSTLKEMHPKKTHKKHTHQQLQTLSIEQQFIVVHFYSQ